MTYYDMAMAGVVIAGMIWGAWRGITWQLASMASLVLGYLVAHPLSGQLAPQLPGEPVVARALAMLVIYAAVSGGVFLAAWLVRATLRKLQFEAFDRHLGMVLGGIEGALIGLVATLFVVSLAPQARGPIFASPSGRVVGQLMDTLGPVLPGEVRSALAPFWEAREAPGPVADEPDAEPTPRPSPMARSSRRDRRVDDAPAPDARADRDGSQAADSPWRDLLEKEKDRLGRAIVETAEKELRDAGLGDANGRPVERR